MLLCRLLRNLLQETNFTGVSGRVQFRDGERYLPTIEIRQHFPSRVVRVGCVHPNLDGVCGKSRNCLTVNETIIHWPAGGRPSDGRSGKFCCSVALFCLLKVGLTKCFVMCSFCYTCKLADHKSKTPRFGVYLMNPLGVGILYILYNLFDDLVKCIFLFQPIELLEHKGQATLVQGTQSSHVCTGSPN